MNIFMVWNSVVSQQRKEEVAQFEDNIREILRNFYEVPENRVVSVESSIGSDYETEGEYNSIHFDDYAAIDWKVDVDDTIVGVAERLRPDNSRYDVDFALRIKNGTKDKPCEVERIYNGLKNGGLYPKHYVFGLYEEQLKEAYVMDTETMITAYHDDELSYETYSNRSDGTKAAYIPIAELYESGCIEHVVVDDSVYDSFEWPPES